MTATVRSAYKSVVRRWRRNLLTSIATFLGAVSLVAILGINQSSAQHLAENLNRLQSSIVVVNLPNSAWNQDETVLVTRALRQDGVLEAGTLSLPNSPGTRTIAIGTNRNADQARVPVVVADAQGLRAHRASIVDGGWPEVPGTANDLRQVSLGVTLANQLGVTAEPGANHIVVGNSLVTVTGIVRDNASSSSLDLAIIMSEDVARSFGVLPGVRVLAVRVEDGMAASVAERLPIAIYPSDPRNVSLGVSPSPEKLKARLIGANQAFVTLIAVVTAAATFFSAITTMQVAVWERRQEIGIRRALGESRSEIGLRFLVESTLLGFVGSLWGWVIGVLVAASAAWASGWTFAFPPYALLVPLAGTMVGAAAGAVPAWTATKYDPAALLRTG